MATYSREQLESIFYKNKNYFCSKFVRSKRCTWNIFLSDRSDGKTFDCKIQSIIDFYCDDIAHMYVRRYETSELTQIAKRSFFNKLMSKYKIIKQILDIKYDDIGVLAKKKEESEDQYRYMIYFMGLSMSGKLKSQIEDERIQYIDFDEYIPLDNQYLKNEMTYCAELYKTVDRDRDIVEFSFFGNKITEFNPFFDFFNLELEITGAKVRTYKDNTIAVQIYHSDDLQKIRDNSKFAKSMKGTTYEDYMEGGVLQDFNLNYMSIKNAKFYVSFKTIRGEGSIWIKNSYYIVSTKKYGDDIIIVDKNYNLDNRASINCLSTNVRNIFKNAYHFNLFAYDNEKAYYIFEPILRKINLN